MFRSLIKVLQVLGSNNRSWFSMGRSIVLRRFSLASSVVINNLAKHGINPKTIIDVGANKGQFAFSALDLFPECRIYCFEPIPEVAMILERKALGNGNVTVFNYALGKKAGWMDFYKNKYSQASSGLRMINYSDSESESYKRIRVKVKRLDSLIGEMELKNPCLLKLDVQGFEKEVLIGVGRQIRKVNYLVLEMSFERAYVGEPLFLEMHQMVSKLGFEFVAPLNVLYSKHLKIIQMDGLYRNK